MIKELEKKLQCKSTRFEGEVNSVLIFRGGSDCLTIRQWLHSTDSTDDILTGMEKRKYFVHWYIISQKTAD